MLNEVDGAYGRARLTRWRGVVGWAKLGLLVGMAGVGTATAQQNDGVASPPAQAGPSDELRLDLLLGSDRVLSESLSGPVWEISGSPGRRLVQWPMRITAGQAEGVLEEPSIEMAGGRFLGWSLPADEADGRGSRSRSSSAEAGPTDEQLLDLSTLLAELDRADPRDARGRQARGGYDDTYEDPSETGAALTTQADAVPDGAPRMAKELIVLPSGRVAWEVERNFPGGTIQNGEEPYKLSLDRDRLRELKPERPERLTRNGSETARELSARQREADVAYRQEATEYKTLNELVRGLPDRFEQPLPDTVWAVFEISASAPKWTVEGDAAGPWTMSFDDWAVLSEGGGRSSRGGELTGEDFGRIKQLTAIAQDPHPWTQRLVASASAQSGYAGRVVVGDLGFTFIEQLLASEDTLTRNQTVYALASAEPATPAAAELLAKAAQQTGDPAIKLASLRSQLAVLLQDDSNGRGRNAEANPGLASAVGVVRGVLADPAGPDAGLVIEQFLNALPQGAANAEVAVNTMSFEGLPADRLDAAVAAVLRSSAVAPEVVGGWLDRKLLGSTDSEVAKQTLAALVAIPQAEPTKTTAHQDAAATESGYTEAEEGYGETTTEADEQAGFVVSSADHALFKLLGSNDAELRRQAWSVLQHFELTDQTRSGRRYAPRASSEDEEAAPADPLTMIVDAGLGQPVTPESLVPFLLRQPDQTRASASLVRVVVGGDMQASRDAAQALLGSGRELGEAVSVLDADERQQFVERVYGRLSDSPEPSANLIRSDSLSRLPAWFGQQLAAGELPSAEAWGEEAGGEDALLGVVLGDDEAVGEAAIAALTAQVGGDRDTQLKMIDRFKEARGSLSEADLSAAWSNAKQDIYTMQLTDAAGAYQLTMIVTGDTPGDGGAGVASDPVLGNDPDARAAQEEAASSGKVTRTVLGVVTLEADGRSVSFRGGSPELSVADDQLALRIATPGQLKSFGKPELEGLPLDGAKGPLDLLPEEKRVWRGLLDLPDGRLFELVMEPFGGDADDKPAGDPANGS